MLMMNKEQQDKLWNELSEGRKTHLKSIFVNAQNDDDDEYTNGYLGALIDMFGEHNLNPKPQIKTWEDVEKLESYKIFDDYRGEDISKGDCLELGNYYDCICLQGYNYDLERERPDNKIILKAIATLKIAKLIELGYGGMVSEEEWKNEDCRKYIIRYYPQDDRKFVESDYCIGQYEFIAFHTSEQRQEFWSHESNRQSVQQYYLM